MRRCWVALGSAVLLVAFLASASPCQDAQASTETTERPEASGHDSTRVLVSEHAATLPEAAGDAERFDCVLDTFQLTTYLDYVAMLSPLDRLAQGFVPGTHRICRVELKLRRTLGCPDTAELRISIHEDDAGDPGTEIGHGTVPASEIGTGLQGSYVSIDIEGYPFVIKGEPYHIVFHAYYMESYDDIRWLIYPQNGYPLGTPNISHDGGQTWAYNNSYDFGFKTYGAEAPDDPPSLNAHNPTSTTVALDWTPGGGDMTQIMRSTTGYPESPADGETAYFGPDSSTVDQNLTAGTVYYYSAWAYDSDKVLYSEGHAEDSAETPSGLSPPSVTTEDATVYTDGATLNGDLTSLGGDGACDCWFVYDTVSHEYGTWLDYADSTSPPQELTAPGSFDKRVYLASGQTYHYRAVAQNDGYTRDGGEVDFYVPVVTYPDPEVSPDTLHFGEVLQDVTASSQFEIWNSGTGTLEYDFNWDDGWITDVNPDSGTCTGGEHDLIEVTINTQGLPVGHHSENIVVDTEGVFTWDYWVTVDVVDRITPPDTTLTEMSVSAAAEEANVIWTKLITFSPSLVHEEWPSDESVWFEESNHFGHKADTLSGYARSGIWSVADDLWVSVLEAIVNIVLPVPLPVQTDVIQRVGVVYEVPVTTAPGTLHGARISFEGDYEGAMRAEVYGACTAVLGVGGRDGPLLPFFIPNLGSKEVVRHWLIGPLGGVEGSFGGSFDHASTGFHATLAEGETYTFYMSANTHTDVTALALTGLLGLLTVEGEARADVRGWLDEVKVTYTRSSPARPSGDDYPSVSIASGPTSLVAGQTAEFSVAPTDPEGDDLYVRWFWDEGSAGPWTGPYSSGETVSETQLYDRRGLHTVRAQAKDDGPHEWVSMVSEALRVEVAAPNGQVVVESPAGEAQWLRGVTQNIAWTCYGLLGPDALLMLLSEDEGRDGDYVFHSYITDEFLPIEQAEYAWELPADHDLGRFRVGVLGEAGFWAGEPFWIVDEPPDYPPEEPAAPWPQDGEAEVPLSPTLSAHVEDSNGDLLTVCFLAVDPASGELGIDSGSEWWPGTFAGTAVDALGRLELDYDSSVFGSGTENLTVQEGEYRALSADSEYLNVTVACAGTLDTRGHVLRVAGILANYGRITDGASGGFGGMGGSGGTGGSGVGAGYVGATSGSSGSPGGSVHPAGNGGWGGHGGGGGGGAYDEIYEVQGLAVGGAGGSGGAGGQGGGYVRVYARVLVNRSTGVIDADGFAGERGAAGADGEYTGLYPPIAKARDAASGGGGGGEGGNGGRGGYVDIYCGADINTGAIRANGGNAGGGGSPGVSPCYELARLGWQSQEYNLGATGVDGGGCGGESDVGRVCGPNVASEGSPGTVGQAGAYNLTHVSGYVASGEYVSQPLDAGEIVDWRDSVVQTTVPPGTEVVVSYSVCDENWVQAVSQLDDSQCIQVKIVMATSDSSVTPTVESVMVTYGEADVPICDEFHNVVSGSEATCTWSGLLPQSAYSWRVAVSDSMFTTLGPIWHFTTGGAGIDDDVIAEAGMLAPSPNPFVRATEITYMVPSTTQAAAVTLRIHDASGRLVRTLVDCWKRPGVYTAAWDGTSESGSPVSSGAYFYSLEIGETRITRKGVLLR